MVMYIIILFPLIKPLLPEGVLTVFMATDRLVTLPISGIIMFPLPTPGGIMRFVIHIIDEINSMLLID